MMEWNLIDPKVGTQTKFELGKEGKPVLTITTEYGDGSINCLDLPLSEKEIKRITECLEKMYDNA